MTIKRRATEVRRQVRKLGKPCLLIVGCGDVGGRIVARLADRYRVIAVNSSSVRDDALRALGAIPLTANLDDRRSLSRLAGFASRVIHLAPTAADGSRDARTRRLVAALSHHAPGRAVYISTSGVYGDHQGLRIDETARKIPSTPRAQRRVDAERAMRRSLRATVLRAPGIYAFDRLPLERLRNATPVLEADADVYTNHVHADDLARATIVALHRGAPSRSINASDDSELKMGDYFDRVADRFSLPRPPRRSRADLSEALSPTAMSFFSDSRRLINLRLKNELRFRLAYPTVDAALERIDVAENANGPVDGPRDLDWCR